MAKFSLLTVLLLYLGMLYFGREAGLPDKRIGREMSLWAALFGGGGESGPLDLLTGPATTTAPQQEPVVAGEPAPEVIARADTPAETDGATAAPAPSPAPLPEAETEAEAVAVTAPEADTAAVPAAEQVAGSERAPARSPRPAPRPPQPEAVADAALAPDFEPGPATVDTVDTLPEADPVEAVLEAVLAEGTGDSLDDPATAAADGAPDTAAPDVEISAAAEPPLEPEPEPGLIVASTFAPEATPRPARKPEPPVAPVALIEPGPTVVDLPDATTALPDPAELAAAALADDPASLDAQVETEEPAPETVVGAEPQVLPALDVEPVPAAPAVETVETVETEPESVRGPDTVADTQDGGSDIPEADAQASIAVAEPLVETLPDIGPVVDLTSSPRPLPRPLQDLEPVAPADLAEIAPEPEAVAAPEPAALPVEEPAEAGGDAGPEPASDASETAGEIVAAPLAEPAPEPEPEPVVPLLPNEPQGVLYVSSNGITVRAGPTAEDRAVDQLPRGSAVVDLGGDGDGWRMILLPNGAAGYIPDTEVSLTPGQ